METKVRAVTDMKVLDEGAGGFSGYASVFDELDADGDIVAKGAYGATLSQFIQRGFIAWSHDWGDPIATIKAAREDSRGLFVEAEFHSDAQSQVARTRTLERLARGKFMGLSIGYLPVEFDRTEKGRLLKQVELFETSLVTVPALASAGVTMAKSALAVDEKAGRRLSAASIARVRAAMDTLSELLGEVAAAGDTDAEDAPTPEAPPAADEGKAGDLAADTAALCTALAAYAALVTGTKDDDALVVGEQAALVLHALDAAQRDVSRVLARARLRGETHPQELYRRFRELDGRLGMARLSEP